MAGPTKVSSGYGVNVKGLSEIRKALKEVGPENAKEMVKVGRDVAKDVATKARGKAQSLGGVAAKSATSVRPSAGATSAGVGFGGNSAPWAPGAEFGGGRRPTTRQFEPWRGSGEGAGYFVYPTIRANSDQIVESYQSGLDDVLKKAGLL